MQFIKRALPIAIAGAVATCAFAQIHAPGAPSLSNPQRLGGVSDSSTGCSDNSVQPDFVPNLVWDPAVNLPDPLKRFIIGLPAYAPMWIDMDALTVRDVFIKSGTDVDCPGKDLLIQSVRFEKDTSSWKCTAFVSGPGSGLNTNFQAGPKKATYADLDKPILSIALGVKDPPYLGRRALLFSPPYTTYFFQVHYVRRDQSTGRIGPGMVAEYAVIVNLPTRADIQANIAYFASVAAGVTQKPKIDFAVAQAMWFALALDADDLAALIDLETIIANAAIDFSVLRDAIDPATGKYDTRFRFNYLVDSDEEPIGCLLIEMANAALWH